MTYPGVGGSLRNNPRWIELDQRIRMIERRLGIGLSAAEQSQRQAYKRFRIAVKAIGLSLGVPVQFDVQWSSPMPSSTYNVDVACSALLGMPTVTITNQSETGCTISFTPTLLATNAVVVALAVAPATA